MNIIEMARWKSTFNSFYQVGAYLFSDIEDIDSNLLKACKPLSFQTILIIQL
jgi:hypothetical protein